ncbi:AdoMet-dependent rRNA methyltransferase spb1 [Malassezia yamatoensis]|uniref:AdoMet-dependent rRNA methyltransferase spb1 n=1 Tax=Malassezia yamatoensis TaxID=253288 RepID=A0AAJ5YV97_9BASI|nr:AdoMet-dependent rRNA methyltransferase spb1 [Malassezia yamatoensis]
MGKHDKKSGKGEQGYRARSAFKLVQLNKKYNFLDQAHCCIDLCAAPGGWLQVASKHMPPNSLIVGVDLVPIKPIPRCITFAEDINSFKCRDQLREHLKDWRADVVLHDGAPNVGTAWVQDAYAQSELTLQALKLAVEFLAPGGTFVTKVFRSKDYNNLVWVFNQLFHHVEATKPPSSRNVSAEIFVVCQRFRNMKRIDPKFLDPKYVFKELDPTSSVQEKAGVNSQNLLENVLHPEKARRKREGYEDGNYTLYKTISADQYLHSEDAIAVLGTYNRITFASEADQMLLKDQLTTEDIKASCEDLRVLGRGDFSALVKWRKALREKLGLDRSKKQKQQEAEATQTIEVEPLNEEEAIDEELARLNEESSKRARKERRKRNEARAKALQKLQLNMNPAMDMGEEWADDALHGQPETFSLSAAESNGPHRSVNLLDAQDTLSDQESSDQDTSASQWRGDQNETIDDHDDDSADEREQRIRRLESGMDDMYEQYQNHLQERDAKFRAKEARRKSAKYEEWDGIRSEDNNQQSDEDSDVAYEKGYDSVSRRKFAEETYDSDDAEDDHDERQHLEDTQHARTKKSTARTRSEARAFPSAPASKPLLTALESAAESNDRQSAQSAVWYDNPVFQDMLPLEDLIPTQQAQTTQSSTPELDQSSSEEDDNSMEEEQDSDGIEIVPSSFAADVPDGEWDAQDQDMDAEKRAKIAKQGLNTAEAVSMAHALVNRQVTKSDLIDQGFSKTNFQDKTDLPQWFLDDEDQHYRTNIPISKEAVDALRAKQRALDARPIKKIAEAKARKKHRAAMRLEKAQKRAEAINENADLTEREKAENINKIMAKSMAKKAGAEKKAPQLVVARGTNRGIKGRPKGTKGRYRMVDPRMKKELRAQKRRDQRDGKKRSSGHKKQRQIPKGY